MRQSYEKLGTILLNKFVWIWTKLKMILIKDVLLILYSNTKIIFMNISLILGLKSLLWKLKMSSFWQGLKLPFKISKNPSRTLIWMQKIYWISSATLWNSTIVITLLLPIVRSVVEFHNMRGKIQLHMLLHIKKVLQRKKTL